MVEGEDGLFPQIGLYRGYIGITNKKIETIMMGLFRDYRNCGILG